MGNALVLKMAASSIEAEKKIPCAHAEFAHAVNSKALLDKALKSSTINFIETDIIVADGAPVLGHDPGCDFDLPLLQMVDKWRATPQGELRGLKLDFKEAGALSVSLSHEWLKSLPVPRLLAGGSSYSALLVNADVLPGDISCTFRTVSLSTDATELQQAAHCEAIIELFKQVVEQRSDVVLSLSWSTGAEGGEYTAEAVEEMRQLVARIRQAAGVHVHVTYPIRASWVRRSWASLSSLLDDDAAASFTVWSNAPVPPDTRQWLRQTLPAERTMYDLPALQS